MNASSESLDVSLPAEAPPDGAGASGVSSKSASKPSATIFILTAGAGTPYNKCITGTKADDHKISKCWHANHSATFIFVV